MFDWKGLQFHFMDWQSKALCAKQHICNNHAVVSYCSVFKSQYFLCQGDADWDRRFFQWLAVRSVMAQLRYCWRVVASSKSPTRENWLLIVSLPALPPPSPVYTHASGSSVIVETDHHPPLFFYFFLSLSTSLYTVHTLHPPSPIPPLPLQSAGVPSCLKDPASSLWSFHSTFCSLLFPKYWWFCFN